MPAKGLGQITDVRFKEIEVGPLLLVMPRNLIPSLWALEGWSVRVNEWF